MLSGVTTPCDGFVSIVKGTLLRGAAHGTAINETGGGDNVVVLLQPCRTMTMPVSPWKASDCPVGATMATAECRLSLKHVQGDDDDDDDDNDDDDDGNEGGG